jgi:hypothetical protein
LFPVFDARNVAFISLNNKISDDIIGRKNPPEDFQCYPTFLIGTNQTSVSPIPLEIAHAGFYPLLMITIFILYKLKSSQIQDHLNLLQCFLILMKFNLEIFFLFLDFGISHLTSNFS